MAPNNFTERAGGKFRVTDLGTPIADLRHAYMEYDPLTRAFSHCPYIDGSGDMLTMQSVLPAGAIPGTPSEVEILGGVTGWDYPVTGSALLLKIQVLDLQSSKIIGAMDDYTWQGPKEIWYLDSTAVANLIAAQNDGFLTIKEVTVSGDENFTRDTQRISDFPVSPIDYYMPPILDGSMAIMAKDKIHVVRDRGGEIIKPYYGDCHLQPAAPLMIGWNSGGGIIKAQGQPVVVQGEMVPTAGGFIKKYPQVGVDALIAAGAVQLSIDVQIGYTVAGGSTGSVSSASTFALGPGLETLGALMDLDYTLNKTVIYQGSGLASNVTAGLFLQALPDYTWIAATQSNLLTTTLNDWQEFLYTVSPTLAAALDIHISYQTSQYFHFHFNTVAEALNGVRVAWTYGAHQGADWTPVNVDAANKNRISAYLDLTEVVAPAPGAKGPLGSNFRKLVMGGS